MLQKKKLNFLEQFWSFLVVFGTLSPFVGQKTAQNPHSLKKTLFSFLDFVWGQAKNSGLSDGKAVI